MASQKFAVALILSVCIINVFATPVSNGHEQDTDEHNAPSREGRFYGTGLAAAQASAIATSDSTGFGGGFGGWPGYGGGLGIANAQAAASAGSLGFGK